MQPKFKVGDRIRSRRRNFLSFKVEEGVIEEVTKRGSYFVRWRGNSRRHSYSIKLIEKYYKLDTNGLKEAIKKARKYNG